MLDDDALGDGEPEPVAVRAGRVEGLEDVGPDLGGNARAGVGDLHAHLSRRA